MLIKKLKASISEVNWILQVFLAHFLIVSLEHCVFKAKLLGGVLGKFIKTKLSSNSFSLTAILISNFEIKLS